jgi:pimeloyl-ACP methyl ester carboxylesterase
MQKLARVAAGVGYHVIVLEYPNRNPDIPLAPFGVGRCSSDPDRFGCQERMRQEILDGRDQGTLVVVDSANSIYTRVTKLLGYLARNHPREGWDRFLERGEPKWSKIAVGGFSLGGGQAALIAKQHRVNRVVLLAAPLDGFAGPTVGSWIPGSWVTTKATPADRYFGLSHRRDENFIKGATLANWAKLGMTPFHPLPTALTDPLLIGNHMLLTNLTPTPCIAGAAGFHRSIAEDPCTPLDANGSPALRWGWTYLLTFPYDRDSSDDDSSDDDSTDPGE